ncbi:MAG: glycosyltransferase [Chromatiales bacterium]|nr:glycosyltransferase [Chromatiales bacterium]
MSDSTGASSARKTALLALYERLADKRDKWIGRNAFFHREDRRYTQFLVRSDARVLEIGCGLGDLLASTQPSHGVGVDFSDAMVRQAKQRHPSLTFVCGDCELATTLDGVEGPFDYIIMSDTIGALDDCQSTLQLLHRFCTRDTRLVVSYYSPLWQPILDLAELIGLKMPQGEANWLSTDDISSLLNLADFDVIKTEWRCLMPLRLLGLGPLINRLLGALPFLRKLSVRNYVIARSLRDVKLERPSTTVVVPCRNERGNIEAAITRTPQFCSDLEFIFVEGGSSDGTGEEIERVIAAYPDHDIKFLRQPGRGKGDAVRTGFAAARGDILMILDADLTMPPEALPRFYDALANGKGNFINGSRLVYPREREAMRFLNMLANHTFAWLFSWLLNTRFTDTLCGTKVLTREHYQRIADNRAYFGDFDPFGDFDLIFGACKQNLKFVEIPVRYAARQYGETQISRFRHGWLLAQMVVFAYRKLKAF